MNRRTLLMFALVAGTALAASEDWVQVDRNAAGDTIYINRATIRSDDGIVRYTEKMVFVTARPFRNGYHVKTIISSYAARCADRSLALLSGESITDTGQTIPAAPPAAITYKPVAAASADALSFAFVCKAGDVSN